MEIEFLYTIDPHSDKPIMLINDTIGDFGIDGGQFQKELLYLDTMGKECIEIWINSPGGSVFDGFSIASGILNCKSRVVTYNVGIAGSIAGVIFMCAKERIMSDYALLMMHLVSGGSDKARQELNNSISMLLSKNSSLSQDQVRKLMEVETWMNYDDCMKNGFCTGSEYEKITPNSDSVVFSERYAYNEIFDYANNIINNINMKKEKSEIKVEEIEIPQNQDVSVNEEVSTDAMDAEVENEVETETVDVVNSITLEVEKPTEELKNQLDEKDILIRQLEAEIVRMKTAEQEKEISNFIDQHVELGKISIETKDSWFNLCKTDFESTKEVIKSLNINKEAPKLENNISGDKKPQSFIEMMSFGKKNK